MAGEVVRVQLRRDQVPAREILVAHAEAQVRSVLRIEHEHERTGLATGLVRASTVRNNLLAPQPRGGGGDLVESEAGAGVVSGGARSATSTRVCVESRELDALEL